jgi:hypothetical protein
MKRLVELTFETLISRPGVGVILVGGNSRHVKTPELRQEQIRTRKQASAVGEGMVTKMKPTTGEQRGR